MLLCSSIGSLPQNMGPFIRCCKLWEVYVPPPLYFGPLLSLLRAKPLNKGFQCWALQNSPKCRHCPEWSL